MNQINVQIEKECVLFFPRKKFDENSEELKFEYARRNPRERQNFVNKIDLEKYAGFVKKVIYLDYQESLGYTMYTRLVKIQDIKPTIYVCPISFSGEECRTINDFKSVLIDHEGVHAKQLFHEKQLYDQEKKISRIFARQKRYSYEEMKIRECEMEIEAYENQLQNVCKRGISNQFKENITQNLLEYKGTLSFWKF
jgi:hypothetical protein